MMALSLFLRLFDLYPQLFVFGRHLKELNTVQEKKTFQKENLTKNEYRTMCSTNLSWRIASTVRFTLNW